MSAGVLAQYSFVRGRFAQGRFIAVSADSTSSRNSASSIGRLPSELVSGTLTASIQPILNGWIIDANGKNYNIISWVAPAFMLVTLAACSL
jgi:hypothetical protein